VGAEGRCRAGPGECGRPRAVWPAPSRRAGATGPRRWTGAASPRWRVMEMGKHVVVVLDFSLFLIRSYD
jgi:hypothetical protein